MIPLIQGALRVIKSGGFIAVHGQDRPGVPVLLMLNEEFLGAGFDKIVEYKYGKTHGQSVIVFQK